MSIGEVLNLNNADKKPIEFKSNEEERFRDLMKVEAKKQAKRRKSKKRLEKEKAELDFYMKNPELIDETVAKKLYGMQKFQL